MTFFRTFLNSIADAGRELLDRRQQRNATPEGIVALCEDLVTQKGEALGTALACAVLDTYDKLDQDGRKAFFESLLNDFGASEQALNDAISAYQKDPSATSVQAVGHAAEPQRQKVLRGINMAPKGTRAIINMREDLLDMLSDAPELKPVDTDFAHLLASWFNRGFLELRRIDWHTPANVLEKLIEYEAVHEIDGWDDLRRRLDSDRRCYAFFHPALPDEPLIFVEVALVNGLAASVQALLDDAAPRQAAERADTAIFYSISNCQKGLRGISFGNFLIKQVVSELQHELPNLTAFSTLSPVPGFGKWLKEFRAKAGGPIPELDGLDTPGWHLDADVSARLEKPLMALCAQYLVNEKRKGRPLNAVARFHLGNGARLERINWLGDVSAKGLAEAEGLLVNYKYDLANIETNHELYANVGEVVASKAVMVLLDHMPEVPAGLDKQLPAPEHAKAG